MRPSGARSRTTANCCSPTTLMLNGRARQVLRRRSLANRRSSVPVKLRPKTAGSGILTHPYLLSAFAYHNNTSPIHRGVFLTRNIVGRRLKPPPVAVAFKDDEFAPDLTMREKVTQLTRDGRLHVVPLRHQPARLQPGELRRRRALAYHRQLRKPSIRRATTRRSTARPSRSKARETSPGTRRLQPGRAPRVHHGNCSTTSVKQPVAGYGTNNLENLRQSFQSSGFHIRELLIKIATTTALHQDS